jgi:hypothetical protein
MYLRLIGAMVFALALVLTSVLAFYIARTRSDLVELPSPIQVRCSGLSGCVCSRVGLPSPIQCPAVFAPTIFGTLLSLTSFPSTHAHTLFFCVFDVNSPLPAFERTYQMLFGLVSASIVLIIAANLLHWDVDYLELWTCLGLMTPALLSLSTVSTSCCPALLSCAWGLVRLVRRYRASDRIGETDTRVKTEGARQGHREAADLVPCYRLPRLPLYQRIRQILVPGCGVWAL